MKTEQEILEKIKEITEQYNENLSNITDIGDIEEVNDRLEGAKTGANMVYSLNWVLGNND